VGAVLDMAVQAAGEVPGLSSAFERRASSFRPSRVRSRAGRNGHVLRADR